MIDLNSTLSALCVWREARGCSMPAMTGVWWVILNRANDRLNRWPKSWAGVVTQAEQFSSFNANDPNVTKWPNPLAHEDWLAWLNACSVIEAPIGGDPTGGATNYYSGDVVPYWVKDLEPTTTIGPFKFFK